MSEGEREAAQQRILWRGMALIIAYCLATIALVLWETFVDDLRFVNDEQNRWIVVSGGALILAGLIIFAYAVLMAPMKRLQQRK